VWSPVFLPGELMQGGAGGTSGGIVDALLATWSVIVKSSLRGPGGAVAAAPRERDVVAVLAPVPTGTEVHGRLGSECHRAPDADTTAKLLFGLLVGRRQVQQHQHLRRDLVHGTGHWATSRTGLNM